MNRDDKHITIFLLGTVALVSVGIWAAYTFGPESQRKTAIYSQMEETRYFRQFDK